MSETESIEDKLQIIKARNHGRDSIKDAIVTKQVEAMKYYTPEIEEFRVGFEYEQNGLELNMSGKWIEEIMTEDSYHCERDEDTRFAEILRNLNKGKVRVKHLDREDIESEGWEKSSKTNRYYNPVTKMHMIHQGKRVAIFYQDQYGDNPRFDGTIKNKSELKKLLKQLGI